MSILNNLISYWPCSIDFLDIKGSYHGTPYNVEWKPGQTYGAAYFDGTTSYAVFTGPRSMSYLEQPFTYSFWIKAPTTNSGSTYLNINGEDGISIVREQDTWDTVVTVGGADNKIIGTQRIDTGEWNHVCVVVSGSASKLYLNTADITESCTVSSGVIYDSSELVVGCTSSGVGYTEMYFEDFSTYDTNLTASGVGFLYNNGKGIFLNNNVLKFNGTTDIINCGTSTIICGLANFTIEAWVRADSVSASHHRIFSKESVVYVGRSGSTFSFYTGNGSSWTNSSETLSVIQADAIIHVAYVKSGTTGTVYVNGTSVATVTLIATTGTNSLPQYIGGQGSQLWDGSIYDLRVWSIAKTSEQIKSAMYKKMTGSEEGLLANYMLDSNIGGIAYDLKGNHGVITGTTIDSFSSAINIDTNFYSNIISYSSKGNVSIPKTTITEIPGLYFNGVYDRVSFNSFLFPTISNEITISFWAIFTGTLPDDTLLFEAWDVSGNRVIAIYLAWSDGKTYWDCGNSGASYDRIVNTYTASNITTLNYWSFVKNATTGSMKVYINGILWHSGTSKTYTMSLNSARLGYMLSAGVYYPWKGNLYNFEIWNKELSDTEILFYKSSPPIGNEDGLVAYYKFNERYGTVVYDLIGSNHGEIFGADWLATTTTSYIGVDSNSNFTVISGTNLTLSFNPETHCTVSGVVINALPVGFSPLAPYTSHTISNIITENNVYVSFRDLNQFTITSSVTGSGAIVPLGVSTYYEFDTPVYNFNPEVPYRVAQYYIDDVAQGNNTIEYTFPPLRDNRTINVFFDLSLNIEEAVLTVQNVEISLAGTTVVSGTLDKGQNYLNCVPFVTQERSGIALNSNMVDVYFTDGWFFVETAVLGDTVANVALSIVELNPTKIQVIPSTFSMTTTTTNVTIDIVDLSKTFLVFCYKSTSTTSYLSLHSVRGSLSTETNIEFYRYTTGGTISGHYYLVKSISSIFSVQHATLTLPAVGILNYELPISVELHRTFLVSSYASNYAAVGYYDRTTAAAYLTGARALILTRISAINTVYFNVQVVSFLEVGRVFVNSYRYRSFTELAATLELPSDIFNSDKCTILNTSNNQGIVCTNQSSSNVVNCAFSIFRFIDNDLFDVSRTNSAVGSFLSINFINWTGYTNAGDESVPTNNSLIRTVEHFSGSLLVSKNETTKYLFLSRSQNVKQCVPFYTCVSNTTQTKKSDFYCDISISSGGIVTVNRALGHESDSMFKVSVVEFYSDTVFVESGSAWISETTANVSISGTTSSGVADINKSAIQFTYSGNSLSNWATAFFRGYFVDNTTINLYRYGNDAHRVTIWYYIIEFLTDDARTQHFQTNQWYLSTTNESTLFPLSATLPIVSYYTTSAQTAYAGRATGCYFHRAPHEGWLYRTAEADAIVPNISLLYFKENVRVQFVKSYLNVGTVSGSISLNFQVNCNSSMVINSNQLGVGAVYNNLSTETTRSAYILCWLSEDGTAVHYIRQQDIVAVYVGFYIIDFDITPRYKGPYKDSKKCINSIENFSIDLLQEHFTEMELTKKQRVANCVPFINNRFTANDNLDGMFFMVELIKQSVCFYRNIGTSAGHSIINCSVIEFNPNYVRVAKYYFVMTSAATEVSINIDVPINIDRSFIVLSFNTETTYYSRIFLRAYFYSTTVVRINRYGSVGVLSGIFYVVESLDDSFEVVQVLNTLPNAGPTINYFAQNTTVSNYSLILLNYQTSCTQTGYAGRGTTSAQLSIYDRRFEVSRFQVNDDIWACGFIIQFRDSLIRNMLNIKETLSEAVAEKQIELNPPFLVSNTAIIPQVFCSISCANYEGIGIYNNSTFCTADLLSSGTVISLKREASAIQVVYSTNLVEFNINNYYFDGTVKEEAVFVDRTVALYRRSTNELVDTTISSGTYGYRLESPYADEHYIVCLDDDGGADFNALIIDRALGTEIFPLG